MSKEVETVPMAASEVAIGQRVLLNGAVRRVTHKRTGPPRREGEDRALTIWYEGLGHPVTDEEFKTLHVVVRG